MPDKQPQERHGRVCEIWTQKATGIIAVTLAFLLFAPASFGQTTSATVLGNVTDASGAVMSGASVTVTNVATGISRAVPTDDFGNYEVTDLVAGNYDVLIEGK